MKTIKATVIRKTIDGYEIGREKESFRVREGVVDEALRKFGGDEKMAAKHLAYFIFVGEDEELFEIEDGSVSLG